MSNAVTNDCRKYIASPVQKAVLMCLADRADDDGYCWPSLPYVCEWTCLSRTAAIEAMKYLESAGAIAVTRTTGKVNRITVLTDNILNQSATRTSPSPAPVRGAYGSGTPAPPPTAPAVPGKRRKPKFNAANVKLPDWIPSDVWANWCADRKDRGKPITERAWAQQALKLKDYADKGIAAEVVINHAIENGHQGFFLRARDAAPKRSGVHTGFETMNYAEGITADGSLL